VIALGVREYANSGEKMRFFLKDIKVDVRYRDGMYCPPYHGGRTAPSPNVWFRV
jgi:hypothetical protein